MTAFREISLRVRGLFLLFCLFFGFYGAKATETPSATADLLSQLIACSEDEPLMALAFSDARTLPEHFSHTHLNKMIQDPVYANGEQAIENLFTDLIGTNLKDDWPSIQKKISGPIVLTLLPGKSGKTTSSDAPLRLTLLVLTPNADSARELKLRWPKLPPQTNTLLSAAHLQTVTPDELPALAKIPAWAAVNEWAAGEVSFRVTPGKLRDGLQHWFEMVQNSEEPDNGLERVLAASLDFCGPEISTLSLGTRVDGESFTDELLIKLADGDNGFTRVGKTIKENPGTWDRLLAAMPGDQDVFVLAKTDLKALGEDLPFAAQALERYLRGKKWSRLQGRTEDALSPNRFKFLFDNLEGSFAIGGRPALSGDLRLVVAAATKNADVEALRTELLNGFRAAGGEFETLNSLRAIGGTAPLGAMFSGRGLFAAPVIGLSPGWAWICSSSAAYTDLTTAFKNGKTAAAKAGIENANAKANGKTTEWRADDAFRIRIDLEKLIKIAYAAWLLSGDEGPSIGGWKVPGDLLPQPQVFNGHLGVVRCGLSRHGNRLEGYSSSTLPGMTTILVTILEEASNSIDSSKQFRERAQALGVPAGTEQRAGTRTAGAPEGP